MKKLFVLPMLILGISGSLTAMQQERDIEEYLHKQDEQAQNRKFNLMKDPMLVVQSAQPENSNVSKWFLNQSVSEKEQPLNYANKRAVIMKIIKIWAQNSNYYWLKGINDDMEKIGRKNNKMLVALLDNVIMSMDNTKIPFDDSRAAVHTISLMVKEKLNFWTFDWGTQKSTPEEFELIRRKNTGRSTPKVSGPKKKRTFKKPSRLVIPQDDNFPSEQQSSEICSI